MENVSLQRATILKEVYDNYMLKGNNLPPKESTISNWLKGENLIDGTPSSAGMIINNITNSGINIVERNNKDVNAIAIDLQKLQNPQQNNATIINNGGNIAYQSSYTNQSISQSPAPEIEKILLQMIEELKKDNTLTEDKLNDAIIDIKTLKMQVLKANKNKPLIKTLLNGLEKIKSIASFVIEISKYFL